jgi:hypothetical protein
VVSFISAGLVPRPLTTAMIVMENTSGDQAIFDGRGRGLISKKRFELSAHADIWAHTF